MCSLAESYRLVKNIFDLQGTGSLRVIKGKNETFTTKLVNII